MSQNRYTHSTKHSLEVKVIQSQHCIEVEGVQLELIYMFGQNTLHVYLEDRLILSTQIRVNQTQVNYSNLIEVAVTYYQSEVKKEIARLKQEDKELREANVSTNKKQLHQYILDSLTTVIDEDPPPPP